MVEVMAGFTEAQSFLVRKLAKAMVYEQEIRARMRFHTKGAEKNVLQTAQLVVAKKKNDIESHKLTMEKIDGLLRMFCKIEANQRANLLSCVACSSCTANSCCLKKNISENTDFKKMVFYCPDFFAESYPEQYDDFGCDKKNIVVANALRKKF